MPPAMGSRPASIQSVGHRDSLRGVRLSRRSVIRAGFAGLLGLGMGELETLRAQAAEPKAKSVIYVFLSGGLSHIDSFDMKPDASSEVRGEFRPIATRSGGIEICEHLPLLAERSRDWALVRSMTHPWNDHSQGHLTMLTGRTEMPEGFDPSKPKPTDWPAMAALANYALTNERAASPASLPPVLVTPQELVHRTGRVIPGQFAGLLGSRWDPFLIDAASKCMEAYGACPNCFHFERGAHKHTAEPVFAAPSLSVPEGLSPMRVSRRLELLAGIERQQRALEQSAAGASLDRCREQAISILADSRTRQAFDVLDADPRTLDRYGRNQFGWSLLMARRLVEAGVSLVQVNLGNNETWDTHQSAFPVLRDFLLPPFDRALSALIDDLRSAGLLESTLIAAAGEFGRTPKISKLPGAPLAGRDHWGAAQTVFLAGGGVRGGTVIGSTDKLGAFPASDPQRPENLAATVYEALGIPSTAQWQDTTGRPHPIYAGEPIRGLL